MLIMSMPNPMKNTLRGCLNNDFYWFWFVT